MNSAFLNKQVVTTLLGIVVLVFLLAGCGFAQCTPDPEGSTAIRFNNESSREVRFFIDRTYACTLRTGEVSDKFEVKPGSYLLIGVTMIDGTETWVSVFNKVPAKNVCTWTVVDAEIEYRTI